MSTSLYRVAKHILPCQHIRYYPHATAHSQEEELFFAIKQYTPLNNPNPQPGDISIIAAHANGVGKELYEPLWDELYHIAKQTGVRIRSIWMADVSFQGESGVLNEGKLGNDPSWFDHPRDLLHMVNHFKKELPRPLYGVGHSMGGSNVVNLALMHPRLFESLILIDPVIQAAGHLSRHGNYQPAYSSTFRRDIWPSREAAAAAFRKNKFYQSWDPRVLDLWIKHGLRELPTMLFPEYPTTTISKSAASSSLPAYSSMSASPIPPPPLVDKPVTLTTTKHQEVFTFLRSAFPSPGTPLSEFKASRRTHPDLSPDTYVGGPFYRPEPIITYANLPFLRPRVIYIFATESAVATAIGSAKAKMDTTGTSVGGSGGAAEGAVKEVWLDGGHFVPFEKPKATAEVMVGWLREEKEKWKAVQEEQNAWQAVPEREKIMLGEDYVYWIKEAFGKNVKRPGARL